jgi:hypothetical protein
MPSRRQKNPPSFPDRGKLTALSSLSLFAQRAGKKIVIVSFILILSRRLVNKHINYAQNENCNFRRPVFCRQAPCVLPRPIVKCIRDYRMAQPGK